jgi:hypothetical protein
MVVRLAKPCVDCSCRTGNERTLRTVKVGDASWTQIQPNTIVTKATPSQRTGHTLVTYKDNFYIFGGTDGQYHYNDTWEYNTQTGQWSELLCSGFIPVAREGHAATVVDDVMYVFGGRGVDGKDLEDLTAFKITGAENVAGRWFMFQHMGPTLSGRCGHAMATWQSKVYVLGGESYSNPQSGYDPDYINIMDSGASAIGLQPVVERLVLCSENQLSAIGRRAKRDTVRQPAHAVPEALPRGQSAETPG